MKNLQKDELSKIGHYNSNMGYYCYKNYKLGISEYEIVPFIFLKEILTKQS